MAHTYEGIHFKRVRREIHGLKRELRKAMV